MNRWYVCPCSPEALRVQATQTLRTAAPAPSLRMRAGLPAALSALLRAARRARRAARVRGQPIQPLRTGYGAAFH